MVKHFICNEDIAGSSPVGSSKFMVVKTILLKTWSCFARTATLWHQLTKTWTRVMDGTAEEKDTQKEKVIDFS